ncbi:peptidase M48 [Kordiimonas sediminis]|uniref:Peptidase M48 n=1 Tax=Kordiimonas sediminis TaxID=1735581 RepID=A0A919AVV9_9PROT|nr:site-2 protease family protein [Kordiimonas sediminis]GHF25986.1 peptidase M48 [Kordiimonas sediminis]
MPSLDASLYLLSVMALPFLLAVTLHEAGHAFAAYYFGDNTAKADGRLSLNPLVHIDPFGTIALPAIAIFFGIPFLIGYAKPVMINPRNFGNYKRDMVLTALAGPAGNLIVAIFCAYVLRFAIGAGVTEEDWLYNTMFYGIFLNCLFMIFNLLPIPPLDGAGVVEQFLPSEMAAAYRSVAPFGFFILMGIIILAKEIVLVPTLFMVELVVFLVGVPLGGF